MWSAMVMDLRSRATRQIFARKGDYAHATSSLTWSPDSSVLALVDEQGITVVDRDRGKIPQTITSSTYLGTPGFSPDSRQITYADDASGRVFVASATGGHPSPITAGPHDFGPVWGPTGIAFTRWLAAGKPGDIWLVQPNGDGPRRLTRTDAGIQPFAFSADGLNLIAQNPASHNGRIWAVDVSTGSARDLTGWVGDLFPQGVSRDGTSILVGIGWGGSPAQPARSRSSPPRVDRPAQSHAAPAGPAGTPEAFPQPEWARRARARVTGHGVMTLGGLGPESLTRRMGLRSRNASR